MKVLGKARKWSDLESRLAASLVYRFLKARPFAAEFWSITGALFGGFGLDELAEGAQLSHEEVLHAVAWMRGKGVDVRVLSKTGEPSVWVLVEEPVGA